MNAQLIVIDIDIQSGTPVFAGTRVPVQNLFDGLEERDSLDVFLRQFPAVTRGRAVAVLERARESLVADALSRCCPNLLHSSLTCPQDRCEKSVAESAGFRSAALGAATNCARPVD